MNNNYICIVVLEATKAAIRFEIFILPHRISHTLCAKYCDWERKLILQAA